LPPFSSTAIADALASQCVDATIPKVPISSGRVVNDIFHSLYERFGSQVEPFMIGSKTFHNQDTKEDFLPHPVLTL